MSSLSDIYTSRLAIHPYGHALYHPASNKELRPGSVGFFNAVGLWNPIANLEDSASLAKYGLRSPTQSLTAAKPEQILRWFPKLGKDVKERIGGIDLGVESVSCLDIIIITYHLSCTVAQRQASQSMQNHSLNTRQQWSRGLS